MISPAFKNQHSPHPPLNLDIRSALSPALSRLSALPHSIIACSSADRSDTVSAHPRRLTCPLQRLHGCSRADPVGTAVTSAAIVGCNHKQPLCRVVQHRHPVSSRAIVKNGDDVREHVLRIWQWKDPGIAIKRNRRYAVPVRTSQSRRRMFPSTAGDDWRGRERELKKSGMIRLPGEREKKKGWRYSNAAQPWMQHRKANVAGRVCVSTCTPAGWDYCHATLLLLLSHSPNTPRLSAATDWLRLAVALKLSRTPNASRSRIAIGISIQV